MASLRGPLNYVSGRINSRSLFPILLASCIESFSSITRNNICCAVAPFRCHDPASKLRRVCAPSLFEVSDEQQHRSELEKIQDGQEGRVKGNAYASHKEAKKGRDDQESQVG